MVDRLSKAGYAFCMELWHGSPCAISEIRDDGVFGGVFAASNHRVALSHGPVLHRVTSARHLTDFELNYTVEGAWDAALDVAGGDEAVAESIMNAGCPTLPDCPAEDLGEQGWEHQRLRGRLAAALGYTSVEMRDEHGTTCLCLPGCTIETAEV